MAGSFLESWTQWEKETTFGDNEVAGMTRFPTLTWDMNPAYDTYESGMITGAAGQSAPAFGVKRVTGRYSVELGYTGADHIWYGILGGQASTGAAPVTNTYTASATLPSWTVQASYGNLPTGNVAEFTGVKFNTVEISGDAAQGYANVSCDLIGYELSHNGTTGVTAAVPTTTITHDPVVITPAAYSVTGGVGALDIGIGASNAYCIRSFNVRIERFLTANRICLGRDTIGEPVPQQPMKVSGTFTIEHADFAVLNALTGKTVHTTANLKWDGGTYSVSMLWPKLVYTSISTPIQSGDVLLTTVGWIAYGTSTNEPMAVVAESLIDSDNL